MPRIRRRPLHHTWTRIEPMVNGTNRRYKTRKPCKRCGEIFFSSYSGTELCDICSKRHKKNGNAV
jgi:formylmethanofuran dehydrogenase subunit E